MKFYYNLKYKFLRAVQNLTYKFNFIINMQSLKLSLEGDRAAQIAEQDLIVLYSRIDRFLQNNPNVEHTIAALVSSDTEINSMTYTERVTRWVPAIYILIMNFMLQSDSAFDKTTVNQILKLVNKDVSTVYGVDVSDVGIVTFRDQMLWHQFILNSRMLYVLGLLMRECDLINESFLVGSRAKSIEESRANQPQTLE
jgi:hypothetical protein